MDKSRRELLHKRKERTVKPRLQECLRLAGIITTKALGLGHAGFGDSTSIRVPLVAAAMPLLGDWDSCLIGGLPLSGA